MWFEGWTAIEKGEKFRWIGGWFYRSNGGDDMTNMRVSELEDEEGVDDAMSRCFSNQVHVTTSNLGPHSARNIIIFIVGLVFRRGQFIVTL